MSPRTSRARGVVRALVFSLLLLPAVAWADRFVDATGSDAANDCTVEASPCATIAHAIGQATAGEVVSVAAGTYAEQLVIDKSLTLRGDVSGTCPGPGAAAPVLDGGGAVGSAVTLVAGASNVTIEGFEITNYRNRLLGDPFVAGGPGSGVRTTETTAVDTVTVRSNSLHDLGWSAVSISNDGDVAHDGWLVDCNQIASVAAASVDLVNATNATVSGNAITGGTDVLGEIGDDSTDGVVFEARAAVGAGVALANLQVQSNTVASLAGAGIALRASDPTGLIAATITGATVSGNEVSGAASGIEISTAGALSAVGTVGLDTNALHTNDRGLLLQDTDASGFGTHGAITATCNRISGNTTAGIGVLTEVEASGLSATDNTIEGNGAGIDNASLETLAATNNFWGDASGPGGIGPGTGDTVSVRVTFTPHATAEPLCVTCTAAGGDTDADQVCDPVDNCPADANAAQTDGDADGAGDACDVCPADPDDDADADGLCGDVDNCPADPNPTQEDGDADGAGDVCDVCPLDPDDDLDADGFCADIDNCPADANPAQTDTDADGDGDACDACPLDPSNDVDTDGVCGDVDNCPTDANPTQLDGDADGAGDVCDVCPLDPNDDADADGLCGDVDNCPSDANPAQTDGDADGLGDVCDACPLDPGNDADADGICGDVDNCPADANPAQTDGDADGLGDACDLCPADPSNDVDADGVCGGVDNCPTDANPTQADTDADGAGDACDACPADPADDADADGVCGDVDNCPADPNPTQDDGDSDGTGDVCDVCPTDPLNDDDADGVCGTTDNCPNDANADQADADADGLGDVCDPCADDSVNDIDMDGVCGDVDNCPDIANPSQADTDGDGAGDACDGELYVDPAGTDAPNSCRASAAPCATIQYAIDQALAGESVVLAPGAYAQTATVDKAIALLGAQATTAPAGRTPGDPLTESIVDAAGLSHAIEIVAGGVVVDGLEIAGDAATNAGIRLVGTADLAGVEIRNNLIHGMGLPDPTSGLDLAYGVFALTGTPGARNVISGLVIENNEIFDLGTAGVAAGAGLYLHNLVGATPGDGATVQNNFIHDLESLGAAPNRGFGVTLRWATDDALGFPDVPSSGVLLTGNQVTTSFGGVAVLAESTTVAESASNFTGVTVLLVNEGRLAGIDTAALGRHVKSDDILEYDADGYFESLQAAVDHSAVNAEVEATAHIFDEALVVGTGVRLRGAKAGQDARIRTTSSGETIVSQTVSVNASGVQIDGFSLAPASGPALQALGADVVGITAENLFIDGAADGIVLRRALSATIRQNRIENVPGAAIDLGDDAGTSSAADDVRSVAVVEENEIVASALGITGYLSQSLVARNVVRDFAGAGGVAISGQMFQSTVESNTVTGYGASVGILLAAALNRDLTSDTTFKCNTLGGNLFGVRVDPSQTSLSAVLLSSNNIAGNTLGVVNDASPTLDAAFNYWGCAVGPPGAGCDSTVGPVDTSPPLAVESDCSGCFQDADCDDGLFCNGTETCDTGSNVCQAGTAPNCDASGADAACNVGTCSEGPGCVLVPVSDGTACDDGVTCSLPDLCQAGTCVAGGGGDDDADLVCQADDNCPLDPNPDQADLDMDGQGDACDTATGFLSIDQITIKPGFGNGKIAAKGSFDADPANGDIFNGTEPVTVTVVEGGGQTFAVTFSPSECLEKKGKVNCRTVDKKIKAKFKPNKKEPGTMKYKLQFKKQDFNGPFDDPVTIQVEHGADFSRVGLFDDCRLTGVLLVCK